NFHNAEFQPSGAISTALGGVGLAQFRITADTCAGGHLAPGATCSITVTFQPVISGDIAATLTLTATPGGSTVVTLIGTGRPNPQTVTVNLSGSGQGTVSSTPAGVSCTVTACAGTFDYNANVTLTPVPQTGSHFVAWTG